MKKRILTALTVMVLLVVAFSLFACTNGNSEEGTTAAPTPENTVLETEASTEAPTEAETEEPLPTTVDLPDAYATADVEYECDDGSILYAFNGKAVSDFEAVCAYYQEQGFRVYSDTTKVENRFTTFVGDGPMAHVYWLKDNGELNIVLSETAATTLPPVTPAVQDGTYEPFVMQLKDNAHVNGMCYIIRLKDGSFIVYDGSYSDQARKLTKLLKENCPEGETPIIRAWVLTHSHNDHFPTFQVVSTRLNDSVKVEYIIYSPLNDKSFTLDDEQGYYSSEKFLSDASNLDGAQLVYAHTGMEFTFCNLKLEVLMTPETLFKSSTSFGNFNDTSVVTRLYDESYSALFLGDIALLGADRMASLYGDYLKSNVCQISHHGVEDVPLSFYETVQASILYYPCNIWLYDQTDRHWDVRMALEEREYTKEILIAGCGQYQRAWGTTFDANAPLLIPDHPTKGPKT
jgi:hypothetical protein